MVRVDWGNRKYRTTHVSSRVIRKGFLELETPKIFKQIQIFSVEDNR